MSVLRLFDPWRSPLCTCPRKYSLHPYTGCSHMCVYCYASSYIGVRPSTPKHRFLERLRRDIAKADRRLVVNLSTSSDPYPPIERELMLTRETLKVLAEEGFKVLITTKSGIVVRDHDVILDMGGVVSITVTTLREGVARILEPGAPSPKARIRALRELHDLGVPVVVRIDPVMPFVNDEASELRRLVELCVDSGASHVVTSTLKLKPIIASRLKRSLGDLGYKIVELYRRQGVNMHGYRYLRRELRERMLWPVVEATRELGVTIATCREGLGGTYFTAPSCDGQHLIKGVTREG